MRHLLALLAAVALAGPSGASAEKKKITPTAERTAGPSKPREGKRISEERGRAKAPRTSALSSLVARIRCLAQCQQHRRKANMCRRRFIDKMRPLRARARRQDRTAEAELLAYRRAKQNDFHACGAESRRCLGACFAKVASAQGRVQ